MTETTDPIRRHAALEVRIRRGGQPYLRKVLTHSPASIGRDAHADICLDIGSVSRLHARLRFDDTGVLIEDAGSRNGVIVNGVRQTRAALTPRDVVRIASFEMRVRPAVAHADTTAPTAAPMEPELSAGWLELEAPETREVTSMRTLAETVAHRSPHPQPVAPKPAVPQNEDDDEPDEDVDPGLPAPLGVHEDGGAAPIDVTGRADRAIEVVVSRDGRLYDVALLSPDQAYWWGGSPRDLEWLWVTPTRTRFPMVTYVRHGLYRVEVPTDPRWRLSHRGKAAAAIHRRGHVLSCDAALGEQVQVTYGRFTALVRSVLAPPPPARGVPWMRRRPRPLLTAALVTSLLSHIVVIATPAQLPLPPEALALRDTERFVEVSLAPAPESGPVTAPEPIPLAPTRVVRAPSPRRASQHARRADTAKPRPATGAPPPSVSVADFKVLGLLQHVPEVHIDARAAPTLAGGESMLRDDTDDPGDVVQKESRNASVTPPGRLDLGAVKRVVNRRAHDIGRCYSAALRATPGLRGRIELEWVVDTHGVVGGVRLLYDSVGSPQLAACMRDAVNRWIFPRPTGGAARVSFPFAFAQPRF